jgi:N-ethylmaleimide reductase
MPGLFSPLELGTMHLPNRIMMAPMTRGRADANGVPTMALADYYAARADAGLLISEGICISPRARGWNGAPSIYEPAQIAGWRRVTDAVRAKGGRLYAQLWFLGRVSHPAFLDGETPIAPSPIAPHQHVHAPSGERLDCVTPREMSADDIRRVISAFAAASRNAMEAGFHGVQIHAANGYLPDQFLRDHSNRRTDGYGGSARNRARLIVELLEACCAAIGPANVSIRLSPQNRYNDMADSDPEETFGLAAEMISGFGLSFLEVMEGLPGHFLHVAAPPILPIMKAAFGGPVVANGGYDAAIAEEVIAGGGADAISFGVPFIANPDLVQRYSRGLGLNAADPETFYTPGEPGYLSYPTLDQRTPSGTYRNLSLSEARRH